MHADPGYPGYDLQLAEDVPTMAESFRAAGYATFMVGKWHLTRESAMHDGADRSSWPVQRGFDHYFGSMDGYTTLFHPHRLVADNTVVTEPAGDEEYLTDTLTDRAISMVDALRASDADRPFFLYFAHHAVHGPVQAKPADVETHRGAYDAGWQRVREERFARQQASGLLPEGTVLAATEPEDTGVPAWEDLTEAQREVFVRHMEVYAGAITAVDASLGRLRAHLAELGELENTLVVLLSDNGATGEGGVEGTRSYFSQFVRLTGLPQDWVADVPREVDLMGGPQVHGHYPRGWAHAGNTPFRYYKGSAYAGGIHVPLLLSWPAGLPRAAGDDGTRQQYAYVTDVEATVLELAGVQRLAQRHGEPTKERDGTSFAHLLRDPAAPSHHRAQYVECGGNRGYYEDGWKAVAPRRPDQPFTDTGWELYDTTVDPAETDDRAAREPDRAAAMAQRWREAAWANTVYPLDDTGTMLDVRPSSELALSRPVVLRPGTPTLERWRSSRLTLLRSFVVEAEVDLAPGDAGVLVAHGDQGGGYVLFVEDGEVALTYNAYGAVSRVRAPIGVTGPARVTARFAALEQMRWSVAVEVGGEALLSLPPVPQLLGMAPFTGISVGQDFSGPVDWELHERHGAFAFSGTLHRVRYVPGEVAPYNPALVAEIGRVSDSLLE